eukprot:3213882-Rhodomonas_salina.1
MVEVRTRGGPRFGSDCPRPRQDRAWVPVLRTPARFCAEEPAHAGPRRFEAVSGRLMNGAGLMHTTILCPLLSLRVKTSLDSSGLHIGRPTCTRIAKGSVELL